jgi:hypothetical protein
MERERKKSLTIAENLLQLIEMKQKGRTSTYCRHSKKKEMEKEEKKIIIIIIIMRTTIIINPGQRTRSGLTKSRHEYEYTKKKTNNLCGCKCPGDGVHHNNPEDSLPGPSFALQQHRSFSRNKI